MYTIATRPQGIFRVFADAFRLYKASFGKLWYWQLLFFLPTLLLSLGITFFNPQPNFRDFAIAAVCSLISAITLIFGQCFLFLRINDVALAKTLPLGFTAKTALRKTPGALAGWIFINLIVVLVFLAIITPAEMFIKHGTLINYLAITAGAALAIFLVLIPQLFFLPVLLFDNMTVLKSFRKAYRLIWGRWWRTVGLLLLLLILVILLTLVLGALNYGILAAFKSGPTILNWVGLVESLVANVLISIFLYCLIVVQYHDLTMRKLQKDTK